MRKGLILLGKSQVLVDIVESPGERAQGLMGRTTLPEGMGMLFWFGRSRRDYHRFWMKETLIPLDLLFVDTAGSLVAGTAATVVGVLTLDPRDETLRGIHSPSTAVLEVPAGWAGRHGVAEGSPMVISLLDASSVLR